MKKRFLFPLVAMGVFGVTGVAVGAGLALTAPKIYQTNSSNILASDKWQEALPSYLQNYVNANYFFYAFYNLYSLDQIQTTESFKNYLLDYNAITEEFYNSITNISVTKINSDDKYISIDVEIKFNAKDAVTLTNIPTRILSFADISKFINFNPLISTAQITTDITTLYNLFYTSNTSFDDYLVNECGFDASWIQYSAINLTNSYNNSVANTIKLKARIVLNDGIVYNGNKYIEFEIDTACEIDWDTHNKNASINFEFNDKGEIIGLKDTAYESAVLYIPQTYVNNYGETIPVTTIKSLANENTNGEELSTKIIVMPNTITDIGANFLGFEDNKTESPFKYLKWINISSSTSSIGDYAFNKVSSLENIWLDNCNSLSLIGNYAFSNTKLKMFNMPNSVVNLGEGTFSNIKSNIDLSLSRSLKVIPKQILADSTVYNLTIPYGVTSFKHGSFLNATINRINIPYTVSSIGEASFKNVKVENLVFPEHKDKQDAISFESYSLQQIANCNIYILGKYSYKALNNWIVYSNASYQYVYFNDYSSYEYFIKPGGDKPNAVYNGRIQYIINSKSAVSYDQNALNNLATALSEEFKTYTTIDDYINFWKNRKTLLNNYLKEYPVLSNPNWMMEYNPILSGVYEGNVLKTLNIELVINPYYSINIPVNIQTPIIWEAHEYYDSEGNVLYTNEICETINNTINSFFDQYLVTQSTNWATALGGQENYYNMLDLINNNISVVSNNGFPNSITDIGFWGGSASWTRNPETGDKQVQLNINIGYNKIAVADNDNGWHVGSYNGKYYLIMTIQTKLY